MRIFQTILFLALLASLCSAEDADKSLSGFSEPYQLIKAATPESGVIRKVNVKEGERVEKGQVLVMLDSSVLDAHYRTARAKSEADGSVKALAVRVELKKRMFSKMQELRKSGAASINELEKAQADLRIAEAELESAEEAMSIHGLECRQIEAQIARRSIRSPIDGVVVEITKDISESVSVADPHLVTIADLDRLRIVCHSEPARISELSTGKEVRVQIDLSGERATGKVEYISPVIDPESGTVKVEITVDNKDRKFRSGNRCRITFERKLPLDAASSEE